MARISVCLARVVYAIPRTGHVKMTLFFRLHALFADDFSAWCVALYFIGSKYHGTEAGSETFFPLADFVAELAAGRWRKVQ
jgi:hypothetical protein